MSTTAPSHATMFTGLYPIQHRVLKNGHVLDDSYQTLAELLRARGFRSAGFVSTDRHFRDGNVHQGFDVFREPELVDTNYRPADETVGEALVWMADQQADRDRLFVWIHVFDPHAPRRPPENFYRRFADETKARRRKLLRALVARGADAATFPYRNDPEALLRDVDGYDAEIAFADRSIRALYDYVDARGWNRDALWVVTSDHGEGLGSHGWRGHALNVYEEAVRVPLLFHFPSGGPRGVTVHDRVEHVDLLPTLSALAGAGAAAQSKPMTGRSLVPALWRRSPMPGGERRILVQRQHFDSVGGSHAIGIAREAGDRYGLIRGRFKYLWWTEGPDELFDLEADPFEQQNLVERNPERATALARELSGLVESLQADAEAPVPAADEVLEKLEALGYAR